MTRTELRRWWSKLLHANSRSRWQTGGKGEYQTKKNIELNVYAQQEKVHQLPEIAHYWAHKYIRPKLERFGFSSPEEFFISSTLEHAKSLPDRSLFLLSLGAGNCDQEIDIAFRLKEKGQRFVIDCVDLNWAMLARGKASAETKLAGQSIHFLEADMNTWRPKRKYDVVIANQALHHVMNLEQVLRHVKQSLRDDGIFLISEIIGRNGHLRWPEALTIVQEFWRDLPSKYKYDHQLGRQQETFEDWDCSVAGFEGVRAQDILPLLIENFSFRFFVAFGNLIDPFVDRSFGPNFDWKRDWDREFIDAVHARDEKELLSGALKPTHMLAVSTRRAEQVLLHIPPFTPEFCVRLTQR